MSHDEQVELAPAEVCALQLGGQKHIKEKLACSVGKTPDGMTLLLQNIKASELVDEIAVEYRPGTDLYQVRTYRKPLCEANKDPEILDDIYFDVLDQLIEDITGCSLG